MMCPACARGSHTEHQPMAPIGGPRPFDRCTCTGECAGPADVLDRLTAVGLVAPPSVRRGD